MEIARIDRGDTSVSADSAKVLDIPHGASCRTVEVGDRFPVQFYAVCSPMYSPILLPSGYQVVAVYPQGDRILHSQQ